MKKRVAISIGDLNGIGLELAIRNHRYISQHVEPIYIIDREMAQQGAELLELDIPKDFQTVPKFSENFSIQPGQVSKESGKYSYLSFRYGVDMAICKEVEALLTLPINKEAWHLAGVQYKGHTDSLRDIFQRDAIMVMGVPSLYVALFTEHIPYSEVPKFVEREKIYKFLVNLYRNFPDYEKIAVLGLNPHAGDNGVLGNDEVEIIAGVEKANREIGKEIFTPPIVPDIAFTPYMRERYHLYVAIYHDQGLAPLKALYFQDVINISINLPIVRVSVGHGTAFDIAYKKNRNLNSKSYLNSILYVV